MDLKDITSEFRDIQRAYKLLDLCSKLPKGNRLERLTQEILKFLEIDEDKSPPILGVEQSCSILDSESTQHNVDHFADALVDPSLTSRKVEPWTDNYF